MCNCFCRHSENVGDQARLPSVPNDAVNASRSVIRGRLLVTRVEKSMASQATAKRRGRISLLSQQLDTKKAGMKWTSFAAFLGSWCLEWSYANNSSIGFGLMVSDDPIGDV